VYRIFSVQEVTIYQIFHKPLGESSIGCFHITLMWIES